MLDRWAALRATGKTAVELSPDGRQRLRDAARRIADFGDLRKTPDGTDLTAEILSRYRPRLDIRAAAEDLRKGAKGL
jgi:hypothetical protein